MLKKISLFILALLCFVPTISFANDAGPILDTEDKMSIEFELKSREAEIGGTLDFTLTLTNNTLKPIDWLKLRQIFKDTDLTEDINLFKNIPELKAGEKKVLFLSANVPQNVFWYKKGNSYYTDFNLYFEYIAWEINEDSIDGGWETYYFYKSDAVPIKLTNVYDGTEILKLESVEKENAFYFGGNSDFGDTIEYMTSKVNSEIRANNISLYQLSDVVLRKENGYSTEVMQIDVLDPSGVYTQELIYKQYIKDSKIPVKIPLEVKAIFTLNDKYYASMLSKKLPTELIDFPEVEINVQPESNNSGSNILTIKNTSGSEYEDFYIDSHYSHPYMYYTNNLIEAFDKNELLEFSLEKPEYSYYNIIIGYVQNNMLFTWVIDFSSTSDIEFITFKNVINLENDGVTASPTPSPSPTASPSPIASPTPKPTPTPSPTPTTSPTPKPTVTASPTPMPSPTASPTPAITVNSITKKPAIPFWVWIAFACALLATGAVSILLHICRSKKEED